MSRIGRKPIAIPNGVTVQIKEKTVEVKGPAGTLKHLVPADIQVVAEKDQVVVSVAAGEVSLKAPALFGLTRTLLANMVQGVVQPWKKDLEIQGVGYRASKNWQTLNLQVGYSHPVDFKIPLNVQFAVDAKQTLITMSSPDKELLGTTAALIRSVRPPEPYKGKGIRYLGEHVVRKAGKAAGAVGSGGGGGKK